MNLNIQECLTKYNLNVASRGKGDIKYIVVHYVGALGDAKANCEYYASKRIGASAHYYVGFDGSIWRSVRDKDIAWHCGTTGSYKHPECRNVNSIGVEMCVRKRDTQHRESTDKDWYFEDATVQKAAALVRALMQEYDVPADRVVRHYDVTGKICPNPYVYNNGSHTWDEFKTLITSSGAATVATTQTTCRYKVGDAVMVSSHYVGPHDGFDKAVAVNPALPMHIIGMVAGAQNPYHTDFNTYANDGDIRGYAEVVSPAPSVVSSEIKSYKGIPMMFNAGIHDLQWALNQDGITDASGNRLREDGIFGEKTYSALCKVLLSTGTMGKCVNVTSWVQCRVGATIDGMFGNNTKICVLTYQKAHGLSQDGIVGKDTIMDIIKNVAVAA